MAKDLETSLYNELARIIASIAGNDRLYVFAPPKDKSKPFIRINDMQIVPRATKSSVLGTIYVSVDIYSDFYSKNKAVEIASKLRQQASVLKATKDNYRLNLRINESSFIVRAEETENEKLWRIQQDLTFDIL